jgi:hypothetical protein
VTKETEWDKFTFTVKYLASVFGLVKTSPPGGAGEDDTVGFEDCVVGKNDGGGGVLLNHGGVDHLIVFEFNFNKFSLFQSSLLIGIKFGTEDYITRLKGEKWLYNIGCGRK